MQKTLNCFLVIMFTTFLGWQEVSWANYNSSDLGSQAPECGSFSSPGAIITTEPGPEFFPLPSMHGH